MNKTANFQLTQWEKTDRIMMEDFNRDNAAIDAALKSNADKAAALQTALASCGNCQIGISTYTGTGTRGEEYPTVITDADAGHGQRLRQRGDQYRLVAVGGGLCGFSTGIQRFHEKLQSVFLAQ